MKKINGKKTNWNPFNVLVGRFLEAKENKKHIQIGYDYAKEQLVQALEGAASVETDLYVVTNTTQERKVLDVEALKLNRPDIYQQFLKPSYACVLTAREKKAA